MILKNLELTGFKSFVDLTRLDFTRGFTAVVGPNGCGKSNISDAVRWVIGEQSSKHLRGTRSTDLIFNGTVSRKPVNRAEVTLTLSDVPEGLRIAGVPNTSTEISVTRCYHRSGESEFYINNVPCRLKDITDLFLDIGISPKVLTVIEQNHIQDIVTSKPEERRIWIEEAAGVLKFKVRKNEALRKLETAGQNLDRISDIVQELERQVESLKRQAARAERYKQYQSEIKDLSLNLFAQKIRRFQEELEGVQAELKQKSEQKTEQAARQSELETRVEQLKFDMDELIVQLNAKKESLHELSNAISRNEHEIALNQQKIQQARGDIETASRDIARMNEEIAGHQAEAESRRKALQQVAEAIQEQEGLREARAQEQTGQKARLADTESQLRSMEEHLLTLWHRTAQKKNEQTALETRREHIQARVGRLTAEQEETRGQWEAARAREEEAAAAHRAQEDTVAGLHRQQEIDRSAWLRDKETLKQKQQRVLEIKEALMGKSSLLQSLRELRRKFEGYGEGVRSLLGNGNGDRLHGLRGVLGDVLKTPPEYEAAIEAVLGNRLQSVIVDSYPDIAEAVRYLAENKSGRGTFIPLHPKGGPKPPVYLNGDAGVIGKALDYIETSDDYRALLAHLLSDVVLVRDFDTALHLHGQEQFQGTVVTLNGEVIDSEGVVTGGAVAEETAGPLARNREMEQLARQVSDLEADWAAAEQSALRFAEEVNRQERALGDLDRQVKEAEIALANRLKDLEQMRQESARLQQKMETLRLEQEALAIEQQELEQQSARLQEELVQSEQEKQEIDARVASLRGEAESQRKALESASDALHEVQVHITSLQGKRETLLMEIQRLESQQESLRQQIRRREGEQGLNRDKIEACERVIAETEQEILRLARAKDALSLEVTQGEETLREREASLEALVQEERSLTHRLQELSEAVFRVESRRQEIQLQITHLQEKAFEDFSVNEEELVHGYHETVDEEEASARIAELKDKVRRLGDVNLAALSDFQVANERYQFLHQQQEDLAASIQILHQTIEKIDQTTRKLFLETFEEVNRNFQDIFARLFLGGRAELSLVDPENPLESGIEITASPAGKAMHNIQLLSGGEKTMTALSMIFALLKVRPSPFCLLDEVDAPLDEANVVRFQEMLQEFAEKTQFIIITHNQKTMGFADTLYGVTMEEQGVSKVVSVHLNN